MTRFDKTEKVKAFFEDADNYIKDNYNIKIRAEIVRGFLGNTAFDSILDIACGSGEISNQFLTANNRLTLLDISSNMLETAKHHIDSDRLENVTFINDDFLSVDLQPETYDLIICTGLLAHVDDPVATIHKMISLSKPEGAIVLQNTDAEHFLSKIDRYYRMAVKQFSSQKYIYNSVDEKTITTLFGENGFTLMKQFSYIQSFLSSGRLLHGEIRYRLIQTVFGTYTKNRWAFLGNDRIYFFKNLS